MDASKRGKMSVVETGSCEMSCVFLRCELDRDRGRQVADAPTHLQHVDISAVSTTFFN